MRRKKTILLSLTRQFTMVLILFTICTAGIISYNTYGYAGLQTSILNKSLESYSAQLAKSTRESYKSYENICYSVAYNPAVQSYLMSRGNRAAYESYQQLENLLSSTALLNPYIIDIAVYGQSDIFAALCGSSQNYEEFAKTLTDSRFPYRSVGVTTINRTFCHILAMPIYSLGTGESRYLGILFLAIDINNLLSNSLSSLDNDYNPRIVFTDENNRLMYGAPELYEALLQNRDDSGLFRIKVLADSSTEYAVTAYSIPDINHTLYVLIDRKQVTSRVSQISRRLLLSMSTLVAFAILLLLLLYRPLIRSLKQLTNFMKTVSAGDRKVLKEGARIHQGRIGSSEIDEISSAFNDMLVQTEHLNYTIFNTYTRMYELEASNRKAEIALLRSQINPHFLYNTLTMICGMAAEGMNDKIISVTGALSQIFRYSIKGSDMVTLREEMEIVRSYLMIQEERFNGRFTIRYEFMENSYDCLIPKMIIQPLVENAILHGLEKSLEPGELWIGAGRNPDYGYLAIWIFDTGVGMPADKLEELRNAITQHTLQYSANADPDTLENPDIPKSDSIGILNVNNRMVLYYGTDYTLLIDSEEGVGTNIQIRVPYRIE
ncbi:two-component system sensor histidine kinase YesM [Anaerotaenia torta]|uniref:sensor histidine kinase n=1 Tax=Anaerotaenia torta TaxID=433293 RepID=UPI003D23F52C